MARYKKIYPKDEEYEQMKKQDKIRSIVTYTFVSLWLVGLVLCKVFQDNNTAVGIISLTIAIATTAYCIFLFALDGWVGNLGTGYTILMKYIIVHSIIRFSKKR